MNKSIACIESKIQNPNLGQRCTESTVSPIYVQKLMAPFTGEALEDFVEDFVSLVFDNNIFIYVC